MKKRLCLLLALMLVLFASAALAACEREEDHRYGSWQIKTSATCTRQGHQFRYCSRCDHWEQRYTSKLPHTYGETVVTQAPTCTKTGREEAACQVCKYVAKTTLEKLPHNNGEVEVIKAPTCTAQGKGQYTCIDCGAVTKVTLNSLGHSSDDIKIIKEPQGKRKGQRVYTCSVCAKEIDEYFFWEGTLYEGMEPCEEVVHMQEKLKDLGFYKGSIRSGQYGELTTSAVEKFQKSAKLKVTGVADPKTLSALSIAWEKKTGKADVKN